MNKFYITTPIYYINDKPHVGHAYSTIAADVLARFHRQLGEKTFFLTGTDENSQKTVQAAQKAGKTIEEYADSQAKVWQETWKKLNISNDDFIRTTEDRHKKVVTDFYNKVLQSGDIYKGKYEGLYCTGHEAFLTESDLVDGLCPDHKTKPEKIVEENYFFKLSSYQDKLLKYCTDNPDFISPEHRKHEIVNFVKSGLTDISITRESIKWGIKAPNDSSQVIYVWFDALINYISGSPEEFWPADLHIVGKDILRFHTVIWPAMLLSAGYPLPKKVFGHGFFTIDGTKISKSLGNAIDPVELAGKYGNDTLRYYLLKEIPFGNDGDFSFHRLQEVYNSDLANGLGNLVSRVAKLCENNKIQSKFLKIEKAEFYPEIIKYLEKLEFNEALSFLQREISVLDNYLQDKKPWESKVDLEEVFNTLVDGILKIAYNLNPFLPETSEKIEKIYSQPTILGIQPLFPRITG